MANRLFLEKAKLVEMIALKFNIKSSERNQSERNSINSMTEKASEDYRLLINRITFFLCHDDETNYKKCKCKECLTLSGVLSRHGNRLLSLYDFFVKQRLDILVEPHLVRGAILDVFILPYLMRVVRELKTKLSKNRTLWYLEEYIKFVVHEDTNSEPLLKAFLRKHVESVPCGLYVNKERYQYDPVEYQSWGNFLVLALVLESDKGLNRVNNRIKKGLPVAEDDKKRWTEARSWHCAGNIVHELLSLMNASSKGNAPWRSSQLTTSLRSEYDFLYDSFLSLNRDMQFSLFRSEEVTFNLVINGNVELHLSLDKKTLGRKCFNEGAQFGLSFNKTVLFKVLRKCGERFQLPQPIEESLSRPLNQQAADNLLVNKMVQVKSPFNGKAEFDLLPGRDVNIKPFLDEDGQIKLPLHKGDVFGLRANKHLSINSCFENSREYRYKEALGVFTAFKQAVSSREEKGITLTEVEEIKAFCERVLNSMPTMDDIRQEEDKLKKLLKDGLNNRYTSFLAWCIFIAKSKLGKLKSGAEIQYCESRILEHQDDYFNGALGYIHQLRHRAIYADFKHDMLHRLGYIRIYNKLVMGDFEHNRPRTRDKLLIINWRTINFFQSNAPRMLSFLEGDRYTGQVINPFTELEKYIDNILRWDSCSSSNVSIDESAIESYPKGGETWLTWLIRFNDGSKVDEQPNSHDKMVLCRTCTVRLYPELMMLAGLRQNPKFASLKKRDYEKLMKLLMPCQCRRINDFELVENKEAGEWEDMYYRRPISL
ncbi:hypothetical protein [Aeromonas sp.]|uniref:hypothetical protein n=1 Tax=Aeromonas sp. TaxID=647 RepID=UPI00258CF87F|nr:hypothetical protein [Aeromonas sp.]MCX7129958.1 hypothetical protein [Aeromonas sp.]